METKLCVSLCALLLLSFGSAEHESDPGLPSATPSAPGSVTDRTLSTLTDAPVAKSDVNTRIVDGSNVTANPTAVTQLQEEVKSTTSHFTTQKGSDTNATLAGTLEPPDHHTSSLTTIPLNEAHSSTSTPGSLQTSTTASSPDVTSDLHNKAGIKTTVKTTESYSISSTNHITTNVITSSHPTTGVPNKSPTKPASVTTTKTEVRADTPSKLNVKGDTTMDHKSPPLDPLLAGLVSAFIVTAIIITLLLFLKLRRRDTRPEFRRLQDLPMDDMMEDTPLSMYSY